MLNRKRLFFDPYRFDRVPPNESVNAKENVTKKTQTIFLDITFAVANTLLA